MQLIWILDASFMFDQIKICHDTTIQQLKLQTPSVQAKADLIVVFHFFCQQLNAYLSEQLEWKMSSKLKNYWMLSKQWLSSSLLGANSAF